MIRWEQDLARLRDQKRAEIRAKGVRVMVSMSSCAIAAGAVAVFEELEKRGLDPGQALAGLFRQTAAESQQMIMPQQQMQQQMVAV